MYENSEYKEMQSMYSNGNIAALKRKFPTADVDNLQTKDAGNDRCEKKIRQSSNMGKKQLDT